MTPYVTITYVTWVATPQIVVIVIKSILNTLIVRSAGVPNVTWVATSQKVIVKRYPIINTLMVKGVCVLNVKTYQLPKMMLGNMIEITFQIRRRTLGKHITRSLPK